MRFGIRAFAVALSMAVLASAPALADEHPLGTITGPGIDLKVYDHAFAGSIRDFVAWGEVNEQEFVSTLLMRRDGQTVRAQFGKLPTGKIGGTIRHEAQGKVLETALELAGIDRAASKILLTRNGKPVEVQITADGFANNHFENPTYTAVVDGRTVTYKLSGHACYGFSLHLSFLIIGAYTH